MGDRDPGVGGRGDARGDPGNDLELDPGGGKRLGLLAAAAEHERVAALQPDDAAPGAGALDHQRLDLLLRDASRARALADVDELGVVARAGERAGRDQAVVEDRRRRPRSARARARSSGPGRPGPAPTR